MKDHAIITEISISGFKSHKSTSLPLAPLTVLIGANAAGKSNALEALRLLSWVAQGQKLSGLNYISADGDRIMRGRLADMFHPTANGRLTIKCKTSVKDWPRYELGLALRDDELRIEQEMIGPKSEDGVALFEVKQRLGSGSSDLVVSYNNFAKGGTKPQTTCTDQYSLLTQMESAARFQEGHKKALDLIPTVASKYHDLLSGIFFLDPVPAKMRGYSFKTDKTLRGDGGNISAILAKICEKSQGESAVLDFIRSLPEQNIEAIKFITARPNEVMLQLTETFGEKSNEYDASLLSDGTLRVLAIAAALLTAPVGSLVVIEEVDNGVHPSRAKDLLQRIADIAQERTLRVLLSSHNPALLDGLPEDAVPAVVLCYRDQQDGSSRMIKLDDLPNYPELIAQGTVGHLMTSGLLDRFVKADPAERHKKRADWIARLKKRTDP